MRSEDTIGLWTEKVTPEYLDAHIAHMCKQFHITRKIVNGRGRAKVRKREVQHPPIKNDVMAYFVALHEVGHVMVGLGPSRLEREAMAWMWALDHSLVYPHYQIRQRICALLVRYLYRAKENAWEFPNEDSAYWHLFRWWEVEDGT